MSVDLFLAIVVFAPFVFFGLGCVAGVLFERWRRIAAAEAACAEARRHASGCPCKSEEPAPGVVGPDGRCGICLKLVKAPIATWFRK